MSTLNQNVNPVGPIRPDVRMYESDAAAGDVALVITHRGRRVTRLEIDAAVFSPELAARLLRAIEASLPPVISLVLDASDDSV